MKNIIKIFIKEIIPVVIGILIALYINNWNENRKDEKYINQITLSMNKELIETKEAIINQISVQKSFIDTLNYYSKDNKIALADLIKKTNGIHMPTIKINSWKAISNSKIELLQYDKISILANIEEQKDILRTKSIKMMDFVYSNIYETGKDKKEILKIRIFGILNTEISIQNEIEQIISNNEMNKKMD